MHLVDGLVEEGVVEQPSEGNMVRLSNYTAAQDCTKDLGFDCMLN